MRKIKIMDLLYLVPGIGGIVLSLIVIISGYNLSLIEIKYIGILLFLVFNFAVYTSLLKQFVNISDRFLYGPIYFIVSNIIISTIVLLSQTSSNIFNQLEATTISYLIGYLLLSALNIYKFLQEFNKTAQDTKTTVKVSQVVLPVIIILVASITLYSLNQGLTLQQSVNIDTYHHLTAIKEIFFNNKIELFLTNLNATFTLATYLPFFHYIFGVPISTGALTDTVEVYRIIEITFTIVSSLVVYKGITTLTKNRLIGFFAAILHIFAFESYGAYTGHFLLPQTMTGIIAFSIVIYVLSTKKIHICGLFITLILLALNHFFVGVFSVSLILIILFIRKFHKAVLSIVSVSIVIALFIFIGADLLSLSIFDTVGQIFTDLSARQSELTNLGTVDLLNVLFRSFGFLSILLILQLITAPFSKEWKYKTIIFLLTLVLAIISIKLPYANKLLILVHYLAIIVLSLGFRNLNLFKTNSSILIIALISIGLFTSFRLNSQRFKNIFTGAGEHIHIMDYEYLAEIELDRAELNEATTLVISDPLTMHMIEPITEIASTGGLFTDVDVRIIIWESLENSLPKFQKELNQAEDDIYIQKRVTTNTNLK